MFKPNSAQKCLLDSRSDPKFLSIIDKSGKVIETIFGLSSGRISFQDSFWKAINLDGEIIPEGVKVKVVGYENMALIVIPDPISSFSESGTT